MEDGSGRCPPPPPPPAWEVPPTPPPVPRQHLAKVGLQQARELFRAKAQSVATGVPRLPQFEHSQRVRVPQSAPPQSAPVLQCAPGQVVPQLMRPKQSAPQMRPQQGATQMSPEHSATQMGQMGPQQGATQMSPQQGAPQVRPQQQQSGGGVLQGDTAVSAAKAAQAVPQQSGGGAQGDAAVSAAKAAPVEEASRGELTGLWRVGSPIQSPPMKKRREDGSEVPQKARPAAAPRIAMGADGKPRLQPTPKVRPEPAEEKPEVAVAAPTSGADDRQAWLEKQNADLEQQLAQAKKYLHQYEQAQARQGRPAELQGTPQPMARPCVPEPGTPPPMARPCAPAQFQVPPTPAQLPMPMPIPAHMLVPPVPVPLSPMQQVMLGGPCLSPPPLPGNLVFSPATRMSQAFMDTQVVGSPPQTWMSQNLGPCAGSHGGCAPNAGSLGGGASAGSFGGPGSLGGAPCVGSSGAPCAGSSGAPCTGSHGGGGAPVAGSQAHTQDRKGPPLGSARAAKPRSRSKGH